MKPSYILIHLFITVCITNALVVLSKPDFSTRDIIAGTLIALGIRSFLFCITGGY